MTRATDRRPAARRRSAEPAITSQLDFFPETPEITVLDPRATVGPATAVSHLVRVRLRRTEQTHLVFHDRHGWYCEEHGAACAAVAEAQRAVPAHEPTRGEATSHGRGKHE